MLNSFRPSIVVRVGTTKLPAVAVLRMEELGEKMTSSRNCELTMMLSTSIESKQEDTEKQHDECFLGQIFGFLRSKYLGERQPLASIAETVSMWKI
jgi:hypothetical protein